MSIEVDHKNTIFNHIKVVLDGGKLHKLNLISASRSLIHIGDITELK